MEMPNEEEKKTSFEKLCELVRSPGYVHALPFIIYKDFVIRFDGTLNVEDFSKTYDKNKLIRTEFSLIVGCLLRAPFDTKEQVPDNLGELIESTYKLLSELHAEFNEPMMRAFREAIEAGATESPMGRGDFLKEAIFYGGEAAFGSQYRDFSIQKYAKDNTWMLENMGFSIEDAQVFFNTLSNNQERKIKEEISKFDKDRKETWALLPAFIYSKEEVSALSGLSHEKVSAILEAFSVATNASHEFNSIHEYNQFIGHPLLRTSDNEFMSLLYYANYEAIYDSPFYWMISDRKYSSTASRHRGEFLEELAASKLKDIFGDKNVYSNVEIVGSDGEVLGEIDCLALFSNMAIVIQAKSKKLTIESRKGNDQAIRDDFKKSVADSYDQATSCADLLRDPTVTLRLPDGSLLKLDNKPEVIYPICLVSENYPALNAQAREFLKARTSDYLRPPFVMDVFTFDAICEFLDSPLYFCSYIDRRSQYNDRIISSNEHVVLSYHLTRNLWIDDNMTMLMLEDDVASALDISMAVRREGLNGPETPDGILTKFKGKPVDLLLRSIERSQDKDAVAAGLEILKMGEESVNFLNNGLLAMQANLRSGRAHSDFTVGMPKTGITLHVNGDDKASGLQKLRDHCEKRKYVQRAENWYGLRIDPETFEVIDSLHLAHRWIKSGDLDRATRGMKLLPDISNKSSGRKKVGRNDPCPCGSGLKYKRCHLPLN